jgi:hypothetical protein
MSFYVECGNIHYEWYEKHYKPIIDIDKIIYLSACGHELEHIKNMFDNIPVRKGSYCKWQKDLSIFIYENL